MLDNNLRKCYNKFGKVCIIIKTRSERRFVMKYIAPEMEITLLETADILLVSGDPEDGKGDNATGDDEL